MSEYRDTAQLTLAIFPVFFPELMLNTMVFNLSHYLTVRNKNARLLFPKSKLIFCKLKR